MTKQAVKHKSKPSKEVSYIRTLVFKCEPTYEEREAIIRRAIYCEQSLYTGKPFRYIITEKDMKMAKIKFFVKKLAK